MNKENFRKMFKDNNRKFEDYSEDEFNEINDLLKHINIDNKNVANAVLLLYKVTKLLGIKGDVYVTSLNTTSTIVNLTIDDVDVIVELDENGYFVNGTSEVCDEKI